MKTVEIFEEDYHSFLHWKECRNDYRKETASYWLSEEGRERIRDTWDDPERDIPLIYLNALEKLETKNA